MSVEAAPETARNPIVNARRGTIEVVPRVEAPRLGIKACTCCAKDFQVLHPRQKFCSNRCRLLYWAASKIVTKYLAGDVPGLEGILRKLRQ
jgi:endogenous inhibitor of DNA gyrase (YacG/DUF329 family)